MANFFFSRTVFTYHSFNSFTSSKLDVGRIETDDEEKTFQHSF